MFEAGHYYGCISLAQAVAEGLSRFVATTNKQRPGNDHIKRAESLRKRSFITQGAEAAFKTIWANDRNDFHHMNDTIETNKDKLRSRADECLRALYVIDCELFECERKGQYIVAKQPRYWPPGDSAGIVLEIINEDK